MQGGHMNKFLLGLLLYALSSFTPNSGSNNNILVGTIVDSIPLGTITADIDGIPTSFSYAIMTYSMSPALYGFSIFGDYAEKSKDFISIGILSLHYPVNTGLYADSTDVANSFKASITYGHGYEHDYHTYSTEKPPYGAKIILTYIDSTHLEGTFSGEVVDVDTTKAHIIKNGKFNVRITGYPFR